MTSALKSMLIVSAGASLQPTLPTEGSISAFANRSVNLIDRYWRYFPLWSTNPMPFRDSDHMVEDRAHVEMEGFGRVQDVSRDPDSNLGVLWLGNHFAPAIPAAQRASMRCGRPASNVLPASLRVKSRSAIALITFEVEDCLLRIPAPIQPRNLWRACH